MCRPTLVPPSLLFSGYQGSYFAESTADWA